MPDPGGFRQPITDNHQPAPGTRHAVPITTLAILLLTATAFASDLAISSRNGRVIDINPSGTKCRAWSYGAMPVAGAGTIDTIYTAGDVLTSHCRDDLTSPNRFGDRIWRHTRNADGTWSGAPIIARDALPWMTAAQPESYVAHLASPAVVKLGGKWFMAFAASVSDPNLCAAYRMIGITRCNLSC